MFGAAAAVLGFASVRDVVVTYSEALAFAEAHRCAGLHDSHTFAQDLHRTFRAHHLGDGSLQEHSQRELEHHSTAVTAEERSLLSSCVSNRGRRRRLELEASGRSAQAVSSVATHHTYTVTVGDSCYSIAQSQCSDGSRWQSVICGQSESTCTNLQVGEQISYSCAGCGGAGGGVSPSATPRSVSDVKITFYAWDDNCDSGWSRGCGNANTKYSRTGSLAGGTAGGNGTYSDPITLATNPNFIAPGTRVYIPFFRKYFVMMDRCSGGIESHEDWVDLWMGGLPLNGVNVNQAASDHCENSLTPENQRIVLNPDDGMAVSTSPFFDCAGPACTASACCTTCLFADNR